jgi:hypothetical protein
MIDYFNLLGQPRRPWLESEILKETFLELSSRVHPDRVHNSSAADREAAQSAYVDFNSAYGCLRDPRQRLRHLIQLERGSASGDIQEIPQELLDLFFEVGKQCRQADLLVGEKAAVTSPLLKVVLFQRSQDLSEDLRALQGRLNERREGLVVAVKETDATWTGHSDPVAREQALNRLQSLVHLFGFYDRWLSQVQERIARLAF